MDEQIAISRIKQGDLRGLESLVKRYQVRAVHAAYLILYDRALAEDVAQGAFLKIAERTHQLDQHRPFAPWFFRIVVNDAPKAAKRRKQSISFDDFVDEAVLELAAWLSRKHDLRVGCQVGAAWSAKDGGEVPAFCFFGVPVPHLGNKQAHTPVRFSLPVRFHSETRVLTESLCIC